MDGIGDLISNAQAQLIDVFQLLGVAAVAVIAYHISFELILYVWRQIARFIDVQSRIDFAENDDAISDSEVELGDEYQDQWSNDSF